MSDITTEQAIQAAGANVAPRITPDDIEAAILMEVYQNSGNDIDDWTTSRYKSGVSHEDFATAAKSLSRLTICVLVLRNGFTVTGENACASPENFNAEIGRRIARENAVAKVWPLMGYQLRQRLHESRDVGTVKAAIQGAGDRSLCTCGPNMGCTNCRKGRSA